MINEMRLGGSWSLNWRRRLFVWEENLLTNLLEDLKGFVWTQGEDRWWWSLEGNGSWKGGCWRIIDARRRRGGCLGKFGSPGHLLRWCFYVEASSRSYPNKN